MGPTWGPPGTDRNQVGHKLATWILPSWEDQVLYRISRSAFVLFWTYCFCVTYLPRFSNVTSQTTKQPYDLKHQWVFWMILNDIGENYLYQPLINSYLGLTRSISWLLKPWLLSSPGHQQPCYWLCKLGRPMSYTRRDFNYLCHVIVEKWCVSAKKK